MLNTATVTKLQEMHLSAMAGAFQNQLKDPAFQGMSFEDRFGLIVDQEWSTRKSNHLKKLMKSAGFSVPGACMENIQYVPERNLNKEQLAALATNNYVRDKHNILLLGPIGGGKTYIGCALGVAAVREFFRVKYIFIYAPEEFKIPFVKENYNILTDAEAKKRMEMEDKSRREYYEYYTGRTWGGYDPHHLMIDSSLLGLEGTAQLIISVADKKFGL